MEFSFPPIPPREWTCVLQHRTDSNPWSRSASLELQLHPPTPHKCYHPRVLIQCWPPLLSAGACSGKLTKLMSARDPHVWGTDVTLDSAADNQSVDASHGPLEYLPFCYVPSALTARSLRILLSCHGLEAVGELQLLSETSKSLKQWVALSSIPSRSCPFKMLYPSSVLSVSPTRENLSCVCVCVWVYIYIYIYSQTLSNIWIPL